MSLFCSSQVTKFFGEFCQYGGYTGKCIKLLSDTEMHGLLVLRQTKTHAEALFLALGTVAEGTQAKNIDKNSYFTQQGLDLFSQLAVRQLCVSRDST